METWLQMAARLILELLLNGLWEGLAVLVVGWLLVRNLPRCSAGTRYAIWYGALVAILILPLLHLANGLAVRKEAPAAGPVGALGPSVILAPPAVPSAPVVIAGGQAVRILFFGWLVVALALVVRLCRSYRRLGRLKLHASPFQHSAEWKIWLETTRRSVHLGSSEEIAVPLLAGLVKPAILFPPGLLSLLSPEEEHRIFLHELAHVRRWDDWTKLLQRIVESVLFFHPAVRWIGRRLDLEREIACDDWAVSSPGRRARMRPV